MVDDALVRNQAVDTGAGRSHAPRVAADPDLKQAAADPPLPSWLPRLLTLDPNICSTGPLHRRDLRHHHQARTAIEQDPRSRWLEIMRC